MMGVNKEKEEKLGWAVREGWDDRKGTDGREEGE